MIRWALGLGFLWVSVQAAAMEFEPVKLAVYSRGETIFGEEFIAASESVVDYLASLRHPTEKFKAIKYQCSAKARLIRPIVYPYNTATTSQYVSLISVYELKDCVEVNP